MDFLTPCSFRNILSCADWCIASMALAVDPAANQLLVLAEGTGTLDVVDLASYGIVLRIDGNDY